MSARHLPPGHPSSTRAPYAQHATWIPASTTSSTPQEGHPSEVMAQLVRTLPCDPEAERGLLSCFLNTPALLDDAVSTVPEMCFYHPANRTLYTVMQHLHRQSVPVEYIALCSYLRETGQLEKIGGPVVLSEILNAVLTPTHYGHYKGIVRRKMEARVLITACFDMVSTVGGAQEDIARMRTELALRLEKLESISGQEGMAAAVSVVDLMDLEPDPEATLLGEGWLRRGGGAIFVGPSGVGKSSASMQQDIAWALGREAFGIAPARPLRILTIQSENDSEDLREMSRGVMAHFHLTEEERALLRENACYHTWTSLRGDAFLMQLRTVLRQHKPDLVRVDPLQGFAGCKIEDSEQIGNFLRAGLNPLLEEFRCGIIIAHHTPKLRQDTRMVRSALDFAYSGAGGAEITNWARAILAVESKNEGAFAVHAAKRGKRTGWKDPFGSVEFTRYFRHAREEGAMHWEEITDEGEKAAAARPREKKDAKEAILKHVPLTVPIARNTLIELVNTREQIGVNTVARTLTAMIEADNPELFAWKVPRPRTNPVTKIARFPQPEGE
ncbi:MAG: AAA family ATPase [Roseimicrobium sp.]